MAIKDRDFEALLSASGLISVFVWEISPGWPVLYVTENVVRLLGITKQNFERFGLTYERLVHPDDYQRMCEEIESALHDPTQPHSFTHEDYRLLRADGEVIWVSDTTIMQRDETGQVEYLFGYIIDITERKQLELALDEERHRLALVLEGTRVGIWNWAPQTDRLNVNPRWLELLGLAQLPLRSGLNQVVSRLHPDDFQQFNQRLHEHLQGDVEFYESIHRLRTETDRYIYVLDRGRVTERDENGRALKFVSTLTDISLQKEAEIEARRAAQAKNLFLANISHEIRTPLHGILGITNMLEQTPLDTKQRELLQTIKRSGDYLLNTLNDVLDLTGAEEGKLRMVRRAEDPRQLVQHIQQLFGDIIANKELEFQVWLNDALPARVWTDHARLVQIATNLVSNAIKFTDTGYISVRLDWQLRPDLGTRETVGELQLVVQDSGIGIRNTRRIWQMFEQEESDLNRRRSGSGLGLAIVKSLVELLGGHIDVQSKFGKGSLFRVVIPVTVAAEPVRSPMATPAATNPAPAIPASSIPATPLPRQAATSTNMLGTLKLGIQVPANSRVLVVDDSEVNQVIIAAMLRDIGVPFEQCQRAQDVIKCLQQQNYDVVFMDIHLPEIDGLELTQMIRQLSITQPQIIALTANAFSETRARSQQAGMNDYITKPFLFEHIETALQRAWQALGKF